MVAFREHGRIHTGHVNNPWEGRSGSDKSCNDSLLHDCECSFDKTVAFRKQSVSSSGPVLLYVVCPGPGPGKTEGHITTMAELMVFQNLQIVAQNSLYCGGAPIIRQVSTTTAVAAGQQTRAYWHIPIAKACGHVGLRDPAGASDLRLHL
jgi:hypothetical protein